MFARMLRAFELLSTGLVSLVARHPHILVVVDMQPQFCSESQTDVLENVASEIRRSRDRGLPIVIVEYKPKAYGRTHQPLLELVEGYARCVFAEKRSMDGSRAVLKACKANGFPIDRFRICGVYTHYCVEETVIGLVKRNRQSVVHVVRKACSDPSGNRWHAFPPLANVQLV